MKLCIIKHGSVGVSETFIRTQAAHLPAEVTLVEGRTPAEIEGPQSLMARATRKLVRMATNEDRDEAISRSYERLLRRTRPDAVLAQYGTTGVRLLDACQAAGVPLIVHFHGYDASHHEVLDRLRKPYKRLFREAAGIVVVSRVMEQRLLGMGAPAEKLHYSPCGVDCSLFKATDASLSQPVFLAVGRFVEKKAPHRTLEAFARVHEKHPQAKLRMIGDGPLLDACSRLARPLGVTQAVTFLGAQPHSVVKREMAGARAFVQHSVEAESGDCEGTPVAVLEAGASGLPVLSTRHAGIPDVVVEGETGLLVDEHDVSGMARYMEHIVEDPAFAAMLGRAGRVRVQEHFSLERNMERLWSAIQVSMMRGKVACDVS